MELSVVLDEIKGHSLFSITQGRWDIAVLRDLLEQVLVGKKGFEGLEVEQDFPGIGERVLLVSGRQLDGFPLIVLAVDDLTEKRKRDLRLAAIVESSDDAIFSKTLDGTIVSWNSGAERIYGYAAHEVIGRPVWMLAPEGFQKEITAIMDRIRRGEKVDHFETKRKCKDGRIIDVSVTISPIVGHNGVVTGASTVARDITERKRWQEEDSGNQKWSVENQARMRDVERLFDGLLAHVDSAIAKLPSHSRAMKELQSIRDEMNHGIEIIRNAIRPTERTRFSHPLGELKTPVLLNAIAEDGV